MSDTSENVVRPTDEHPVAPDLLRLLIVSAYANYCSSLIGGPEISRQRFEFFKNFKPGDLVMETSTMFSASYDHLRLGYLVSDQMEPYGSDEWWEQNKADYDGKRPEERVYTIKRLIGGEPFRWLNASIVRVVTKAHGEFP